jgi:hypothetical protein
MTSLLRLQLAGGQRRIFIEHAFRHSGSSLRKMAAQISKAPRSDRTGLGVPENTLHDLIS